MEKKVTIRNIKQTMIFHELMEGVGNSDVCSSPDPLAILIGPMPIVFPFTYPFVTNLTYISGFFQGIQLIGLLYGFKGDSGGEGNESEGSHK